MSVSFINTDHTENKKPITIKIVESGILWAIKLNVESGREGENQWF